MTTIDQMHQWCVEARNMLGTLDKFNTKDLKVNSEAVLALLTTMQNDPLKATRYPQLANFEADYETYSNAARQQPKKKVLERVTSDLKNLQQRLKSAIGNADPKASPEIKKQVVAEARHKPVYDNKCKRIQAAIDELKPLPGTGKHVLKLEALLAAGAMQAPDYEKAYKALQGLTKARKEGHEAAEKWGSGEFDSNLKKGLAALRQALALHEQLAGIGDAEYLQQQHAWINDSLVALAGGTGDTSKVDKKKLSKLVGDLTALTDKVKLHTTEYQGDQSITSDHQDKLHAKMQLLAGLCQVDELGGLMNRFNNAQSLAGSQKYKAANEIFATLKTDIETAEKNHTKARDDWTQIDTELTEGVKLAREIAASKLDVPPEMAQVASQIESLVLGKLRGQLVPARQFAEATKLATDLKLVDDLAMLRQQFANLKASKPVVLDFKGERALLSARLQGFEAPLREAHALAEQAITALAKAGGHAEPQRQALSVLMADWKNAANPFTLENTPVAERLRDVGGLEVTAKALKLRLDRLVAAIQEETTNPQQLDTSKKGKQQADEAQAFEQARKKAQAALGYLDDLDDPTHAVMTGNPSLDSLKTRYQQLVDEARQHSYGTPAMDKLDYDAANKRQLFEAALGQQRQASQLKVQTLTKQIATLRNQTPDAYEGFVDKVQDELTSLAGLVNSKSPALMKEGITQLDQFDLELQEHIKAVRDPAGNSFLAVNAKIQELKDLLKAKDMKACEPARQGQLLAELKDVLPAELAKLSPEKALARLAEHELKVKALRTDTDKVTLRHADLLKKARELRVELAKQLQATAPTLFAELSKRLSQIDAMKESDTAHGELQLKSVTLLMASAVDPGKREIMEAKAQTDVLQGQKDEAAYKAALDVFEKDTQRAADNAKSEAGSDHNAAGYELIAMRLKDAKDAGDKKDYGDARDKLRLAETAAHQFIQAPYKPTVAAGRALLGASANWQDAVGRFLGQVLALRNEIKRQCGEESPARDCDAELKALAPLDQLFNPVTFEHAAGLLSRPAKGKGDSTERAERRAEKEKILVIVNRYLRLVEENLLLKTAIDNPFSPVDSAEMKRALNSLRAAFLAA